MRLIFFIMGCLLGSILFADGDNIKPETAVSLLSSPLISLNAPQANLTFSGRVINENDEELLYYFHIQRNKDLLNATATLVDSHSKRILLLEEGKTTITNQDTDRWQINNIFLRFNPINSSWVFGVKDKNKNKTVFNFKIDTLGQADAVFSKPQPLRKGIIFSINQTGRLNGHVQLDDKEQFVTGKKTWLRQLWMTNSQEKNHNITATLCNFDNGSSFYSVNLEEPDALRGSIAGWRDKEGVPVVMSQFVAIDKTETGSWTLHIPTPKIALTIANLLIDPIDSNQLVVGFTQGTLAGFCSIEHDQFIAQDKG